MCEREGLDEICVVNLVLGRDHPVVQSKVMVRRLGWTGRQMFMGTVAPVSPCPAMLWPPLHVWFLCGTPYSDKMGHCCITFYRLSVLRDCGRVGKRKR